MVMATVYTLAGRFDEALDELETVMGEPCPYTAAALNADPLFETLRDHPRFKALLDSEHSFQYIGES